MKMLEVQISILVSLLVIPYVAGQCSSSSKTATEVIMVNETLEIFKSPGYRVAYFSNMDCKWIFDAGRSDATIVFEVQELLMETSRNCAFDALVFYEGSTTSDTVLKKACGRLYAGQSGSFITASGQYAMIRMKSDRSRQYAGAKISYFYAVENSGNACSGTSAAITATLASDYLTSPGYPIGLDNGVDCSWTITCQATTILRLEVFYSDMEYSESGCLEQVMAIYDGSSSSAPALLESWCDSSTAFPSQPTVYYTTDNVAYVTLTTTAESIAERHGFQLNFRQNSTAVTTTPSPTPTTSTSLVQVCSSSATHLEANDTWKYFQTLNYPNYYPNDVNCYWRIEAPAGYAINLTFNDVFVQDDDSCGRDVINVYDGRGNTYPLLASFCGEETPVLQSTGRYMFVVFKTDTTINYRGFSAQYQLMPAELPTCSVVDVLENLTATTDKQNFTSPNYPDGYNNSMTVYWMLQNPNQTQTMAIEVGRSRIEASKGCIYDYVKVYDGPCESYPVLGKFCSDDKPKYYATGSYALVKFVTDGDLTDEGFLVKYYLEDKEEDDYSILIITGIVVGSLLGAAALIGLASFVGYKVYKRGRKHVPSRDSSRRSSASSESSLYKSTRRLKLSDLLRPPSNLYK